MAESTTQAEQTAKSQTHENVEVTAGSASIATHAEIMADNNGSAEESQETLKSQDELAAAADSVSTVSLSNSDTAAQLPDTQATPKVTSKVEAPLEVFTLFPELPIELRLKIWNEAMPGLRVVEILWNPTHGLYTDCPLPITFMSVLSLAALPWSNYEQDILYFSQRHTIRGGNARLGMLQRDVFNALKHFKAAGLQHIALYFEESSLCGDQITLKLGVFLENL
ncbi:uncharacterized protein PAC_05055 [Phialocephala subalpina]|uniref:2EXR domain-containing protein n=1 Tax=Phialocephala subalpina TaxID=576137 RepID=A0A1L7WQW7_9HELO|nr:uncharacterized protein PAC_05055 [Phialocephala subalpina]